MKNFLTPFATVLIPPVWTWGAGLFAEPLAHALRATNPELSGAALQGVVFTGAAMWAGVLLSKQYAPEPTPAREMTTGEMRRALEAGRQQEREYAELQQYAADVQAKSSGFRMNVGSRLYHFPNGIFPDHLIALADVLVMQGKPTDRALVPPFERGSGNTYQVFRDWMIYHAGDKPGKLASYASQKGDWNLTIDGRYVLLQWLDRLSHSPTEQAGNAKKARLALSKATREQLSKGE